MLVQALVTEMACIIMKMLRTSPLTIVDTRPCGIQNPPTGLEKTQAGLHLTLITDVTLLPPKQRGPDL